MKGGGGVKLTSPLPGKTTPMKPRLITINLCESLFATQEYEDELQKSCILTEVKEGIYIINIQINTIKLQF